MRIIYTTIYNKLEKLGYLNIQEHAKIQVENYMDINIDILQDTPKIKRISIAHNYIQNGDVMADPDMEIRIFKESKMAEAMTYQQDNLAIYRIVYPSPRMVNLGAKKELNTFLNKWLSNLISQGFKYGD